MDCIFNSKLKVQISSQNPINIDFQASDNIPFNGAKPKSNSPSVKFAEGL